MLTFVRNGCENSFSLSVNQTILIAVPSKKEKLPLSVTHPELAKEADGWDPKSVNAGSHKKMNWQCSKGHIWAAMIGSRAGSKESGCPSCAKYGFSPDKDAQALLHLVTPAQYSCFRAHHKSYLPN